MCHIETVESLHNLGLGNSLPADCTEVVPDPRGPPEARRGLPDCSLLPELTYTIF